MRMIQAAPTLPDGFRVLRLEGPQDPKLMEEIYRLRLTVWRQHGDKMVGDFTSGFWSDGEELRSVHWALFFEDTLIAASRLTFYDTLSEVPDGRFYSNIPAYRKGHFVILLAM